MTESKKTVIKGLKNPEAVNYNPTASAKLNQRAVNHNQVAPSQLDIENKLSNIKSEHRFIRDQLLSQEKRVRLRDYLFTARSSLQKNRELKKEMKNKIVEKDNLKKSIQNLKKNKYQISNHEMHKIVKKEIQTELKDIISSLDDDLKYIQGQDLNQVSKEDLVYFYEIRYILREKIRPSIHQMKKASFSRQKGLIEQVLMIGNDLATQSGKLNLESKKLELNAVNQPPRLKEDPIKIQIFDENHKEGKYQSEKNKPIDLIESIFLGKK